MQRAQSMLQRLSGPGAGLLIGVAGAAYTVNESLFTVDPGHRAVMFSRLGGVQKGIYGEGMHFRMPWLQYPIVFDVRSRARKIPSLTGSKDLQMVNITLRVLARPDVLALPEIYRTLGTDYDERILPSIVNEVLKSVVAQFNASQLITMREKVSTSIRSQLMSRAKDFNIVLDDVSITELSFGKEYTAAVEAKQVAQQEAQRAQFIVEKAKQERQEKIVNAEGEAESARLIGQSVRENPGFLQLRRIEAAREIAHTLSNSPNKLYLNTDALLLYVEDSDKVKKDLENPKKK